LQTEVDQLSLDYYTFRITVTDSNGLSAFDEVNLIRVSDSTLTLVEIDRGREESDDSREISEFARYNVNVTPNLIDDESLSVTFDSLLELSSSNYEIFELIARIRILKNNTEIFNFIIRDSDMNSNSLTQLSEDSVFSINATDEIRIIFFARTKRTQSQTRNENGESFAKITLKSAVFTGADREITNLPVSEQVRALVFL